ncbi:uncharacterized protein LOC123892291 [Trifolium pratense]|uniref:uncharacterized protein LOC123892291 n=1 Tax=Trifolium pratense TaxID=57577 RepID=UPI001E697C1A|nr:uncharacterized protein LOC123892291 [Trifolium pratense]
MSNSAKSSPIKDASTHSTMGGDSLVINAIPLSSIPPISPAKRVKKASKKVKPSQVILNSSSPSASIKKTKKKSKKSRTESGRSFTMSELHVDPLPSSDVAAPVVNPAEDNVIASGKNSLNLGLDVPNSVETLDVENPTVSENLGKKTAADKVVNENPEVIIVNETTVSDKSVPTYSEASVARRTRSRADKGVETANTPVQTPKPSRAGKDTGKKPLYGPPKPVSKVVPRTETKKRKAPPTSDSEFEPETDVVVSGSTSRKSIGRKKVPQSVPYAPLDNVSFHLENGSARWKFVYHRRLALERNLKDDILQCQSVVEAIEYAASHEYRQVFVRGKCVKFSPTVINRHMQRNTDEVAALKVTDNEVCKVLTGGRIKVWSTKAKLAATSLSPFYAVLNKIAAHNWVPTTHSGDVVRGLGKFIYAVGTKAKVDYGSYFFQETLSHALTYAIEKPVALPTLLCNIILEQHQDILRSTDVPCKRKGMKQMIADLTEASRALEARKLKIDRVIEALKAEEAAETAEGESAGQEGVETSGSDDDTDESSSI